MPILAILSTRPTFLHILYLNHIEEIKSKSYSSHMIFRWSLTQQNHSAPATRKLKAPKLGFNFKPALYTVNIVWSPTHIIWCMYLLNSAIFYAFMFFCFFFILGWTFKLNLNVWSLFTHKQNQISISIQWVTLNIGIWKSFLLTQ